MSVSSLSTIVAQGGYVMWPLIACSLVAVFAIIERSLFWLVHFARTNRGLRARLEQAKAGERTPLIGNAYDPAVQLMGVRETRGNAHMLLAFEAARARFRRLTGVLDSVISIAPLLGILGTVVGIMVSFNVAASENGRPDPVEAMVGIAQAFITTAAGLTIAVVSLIAFNAFAALEQKAVAEIQALHLRLYGTAVSE